MCHIFACYGWLLSFGCTAEPHGGIWFCASSSFSRVPNQFRHATVMQRNTTYCLFVPLLTTYLYHVPKRFFYERTSMRPTVVVPVFVFIFFVLFFVRDSSGVGTKYAQLPWINCILFDVRCLCTTTRTRRRPLIPFWPNEPDCLPQRTLPHRPSLCNNYYYFVLEFATKQFLEELSV